MIQIVLPKTYTPQIKAYPIIYLAGPIRGAPSWHDEAITFFLNQSKDMTIVSPNRELRGDLKKYLVKGEEKYFPRQRVWENYCMDIISKKGCVMFWLPGEQNHNCNKPYASMTRKELGDITKAYKYSGKKIHFCMGSDGKFFELDTLMVDFARDCPNKKIFDSLEKTCTEALQIATGKKSLLTTFINYFS